MLKKHYLFILLNVLSKVLCQQTLFLSKSSTIPSNIYELYLERGDTLKATLTWYQGGDLDIYLFSQGSNLLSNSGFLDRQYSNSQNPQILQYLVLTTGTYYLRADDFSGTVPHGYIFQIQVNGTVVETHIDYITKVDTGKISIQFQLINACTMRVEYNGPSYDFEVYKPNTSIHTDPPFANGTAGVQNFTFSPNSSGIWIFVIKHDLVSNSSVVNLTNYSVNFYTQTSSQCISFCSTIVHAASTFPSSNTKCICNQGFEWNSTSSKCQIICSSITKALVKVGFQQCSCETDYEWQTATLSCIQTCANHYYWNGSSFSCWIDCTIILYGLQNINEYTCSCQDGYTWVGQKCIINCDIIDNAISSLSQDNCKCEDTFNWNQQIRVCQIQQTTLNIGIILAISISTVALILGILFGVYFVKVKLSKKRKINIQGDNKKIGEISTMQPDISL